MKTALVTINSEEAKEILEIVKEKKGLVRISSIIPKSDSPLLTRNTLDIEECEKNFTNWWNKISKKYNLKSTPNGKWQIDFKTNTIYLIEL